METKTYLPFLHMYCPQTLATANALIRGSKKDAAKCDIRRDVRNLEKQILSERLLRQLFFAATVIAVS